MEDLSQLKLNRDPPRVVVRRAHWRRNLSIAVALAGALGVAIGWQRLAPYDPPKHSPSAHGDVPPEQAASSLATVTAGGYLEAREDAELVPPRGTVQRVFVRPGDKVKRGDVLVQLDASHESARRDEARADLNIARATLGQVRSGLRPEAVAVAKAELRKDEASLAQASKDRSRIEAMSEAFAAVEVERARTREVELKARVDAGRSRVALAQKGGRTADAALAKARVARATAALRTAELELADKRVTAPFDALVLRVELSAGERVGPEIPNRLIQVADLSEVRARVDIPEHSLHLLVRGARAEVVVEAAGSRAFGGEVVHIEPFADRSSNTVEVILRIDKPSTILVPGLSARVSVFKDNNHDLQGSQP